MVSKAKGDPDAEEESTMYKIDITYSTSALGLQFRPLCDTALSNLAAKTESAEMRWDKVPRNPKQRALYTELEACRKLVKGNKSKADDE